VAYRVFEDMNIVIVECRGDWFALEAAQLLALEDELHLSAAFEFQNGVIFDSQLILRLQIHFHSGFDIPFQEPALIDFNGVFNRF